MTHRIALRGRLSMLPVGNICKNMAGIESMEGKVARSNGWAMEGMAPIPPIGVIIRQGGKRGPENPIKQTKVGKSRSNNIPPMASGSIGIPSADQYTSGSLHSPEAE